MIYMLLHDHKPLTFHHMSALIEGDFILPEIDKTDTLRSKTKF